MRQAESLYLGSILAALILSADDVTAAPGHKTPKECNSELYSQMAAIRAAGESPAQFIHDCWWNSQTGQPTAIVHPGAAAPQERSREVKATPPQAERSEARRLPRALRHPRVLAHRIARKALTREAQRVGTRRHDAVRIALAARRLRMVEALRSAVRPTRWRVVGNDPLRPRLRRERFAVAASLRRVARVERPPRPISRPESIDRELTSATANLGPTARLGQRMWVRVVAAGEVHIKPALAVDGLSARATKVNALNCWGQSVMFVGRGGDRWSREMVCDAKPAGENEWSAQIYYGGPAH